MRLPLLHPDDLTPEQQAVYAGLTGGGRLAGAARAPGDTSPRMLDDEGRLQGPFNAFLFHPPLGGLLQELSRTLRFDGVLSARTREAVIITVAAHERSAFEWAAHARIARDVGIDEATVEAVARGEDPTFSDALDDAAARLARSLLRTGDADDATWAAVAPVLGEAGVFEVSTTVAFYGLLAQQLRLFRVPAPPGPFSTAGG